MVSAFKRLQDLPFPAWARKNVYRWLMGAEVLCALVVLGTSAAVISDFSTWSSCTSVGIERADDLDQSSPPSRAQLKNCTIPSTSPQGYINMALFTSIVGFLFTGTLAIGEYVVQSEAATQLPVTAARPGLSSTPSAKERHATDSAMSRMDQKVLFVASLVFYPLLWTFWVTSAITTSILCADAESKWDTLNAVCAFTWLSWFATTGSCYIVGKEAWEGRSGRACADDKVDEEQSRGNVTAEAASGKKSALRSSGGSGRVERSGTAAMTTSAGSGMSRGRTQSGRSRERGMSTDTGRQSGRRKDPLEETTGEVTSRDREMRTPEERVR